MRFRDLLLPFLLALVSATLAYLATGPTLGLFLAGLALAALLVPPLALSTPHRWHQVILASLVADAIALVWLIATLLSPLRLMEWLWAYLVLLTFALALWSLARLLATATRSLLAGAALTAVLALAWLSWPIWLAPTLARPAGTRLAALLTPAHPPLAINAALRRHGVYWHERPLAYRELMNLNQDVPFTLPRHVGYAVALHALIALAGLFNAPPPTPAPPAASADAPSDPPPRSPPAPTPP